MPDDPLHSLLATTYTKDNFHRKAMLLKEFFSKHFFSAHDDVPVKESLRSFLAEQNVGEALQNTLTGLPDAFFDSFTKDNVSQLIKRLEEDMEQKPVIVLYVPTVLPPEEVEKLGKWARENIKPEIFIDLRVDANVIGGCSFVWNGVHHDYSLRYYMEKNRSEIRNLVRSLDNG